MKFNNDGRRYVIALSRGEQVVESIRTFCKAQNIHAAAFQAIGAVENPEIGYYDVHKKEYFFTKGAGEFEVASMTGNVAIVEGQPFVHAHGVLTACSDSAGILGGHLKEAQVAVTVEVFLISLDIALKRTLDDVVGLKLLDL